MHEVKFSVSCNNNKACTEFISFISKSVFEESIKSKIIRSKFIAVQCDGTDSAVVEKESIYDLFVDPDTIQPSLSFLYLKDLPSQDADGIVKDINSLCANPTKWSNTLKQFVGNSQQPTNCLSVFDQFAGLALKGLKVILVFTTCTIFCEK